MRRASLLTMAMVLSTLLLGACGGGGGGGSSPEGDGGDPGGDGGSSGGEAAVPGDCGRVEDGDLDRTVLRAGGQLRLCIRESEVRLWALDDHGRIDPGFAKADADIYFTAGDGEEQMINGLLLKGSPEEGFATRMVGHGGEGVSAARVVLGNAEIRVAP